MLDPAFVREHVEEVRTGLQHRGADPHKALEDIATFETIRKRLIHDVENLRRLQRTSGDEVFKARRLGQDTAALQDTNRARGAQIKQLEMQLESAEHQRNVALLTLPNLPHESVPIGATAADNVEVRRHGTPRTVDFEPKAHWDIG